MSCNCQPGGAGRFYGKYRGKVLENVDPAFIGRILADVPLVPAATLNWALPCTPYAGPGVGFYAIPPVGADVWIEFEGGDPNYPIWAGCFWTEATAPLEAPVPELKIFKTDFLTMILNDTPGTGGYLIEYYEPGEMDAPFSITIDGAGIQLSAPPALETLISEEGITLEYPESTIEMTAASITATVPPTELTLTAEVASIEAPTVNITSEELTAIDSALDVTVDATGAIEVSALGDVTVDAALAVEVSAGADLALEAGLALEVTGGLDVSIESALVVDIQAPDLALTAAATEITSVGIALTGLVEVTGDELLDGQQVLAI
jgi:hypothetical protein